MLRLGRYSHSLECEIRLISVYMCIMGNQIEGSVPILSGATFHKAVHKASSCSGCGLDNGILHLNLI